MMRPIVLVALSLAIGCKQGASPSPESSASPAMAAATPSLGIAVPAPPAATPSPATVAGPSVQAAPSPTAAENASGLWTFDAERTEAPPSRFSFGRTGDFTHVSDACTFETQVEQFELKEAGLSTIGEIIHDIDVKDGTFGRAEGPGVAALIAGIALAEKDDDARIQLGVRVFDALLALYRRRRG